jgi:hypothetical protein
VGLCHPQPGQPVLDGLLQTRHTRIHPPAHPAVAQGREVLRSALAALVVAGSPQAHALDTDKRHNHLPRVARSFRVGARRRYKAATIRRC